MNKWLSILLFGGIGFGLGFFTGERVGERKKSNAKPVEFVGGEEKYVGIGDPVFDEEVNKRVAETIAKNEGYISQEEADAANAYFAQFESPQEEDPLTDEDVLEEDASPEITVITAYQYETETEFEHKELFFYTEDGVVCDEDEKRIDDPEELIGEETLKFLSANENDVAYIRNAWTECVYCIEAIDNAYGRVVLGIDEQYPI